MRLQSRKLSLPYSVFQSYALSQIQVVFTTIFDFFCFRQNLFGIHTHCQTFQVSTLHTAFKAVRNQAVLKASLASVFDVGLAVDIVDIYTSFEKHSTTAARPDAIVETKVPLLLAVDWLQANLATIFCHHDQSNRYWHWTDWRMRWWLSLCFFNCVSEERRAPALAFSFQNWHFVGLWIGLVAWLKPTTELVSLGPTFKISTYSKRFLRCPDQPNFANSLGSSFGYFNTSAVTLKNCLLLARSSKLFDSFYP